MQKTNKIIIFSILLLVLFVIGIFYLFKTDKNTSAPERAQYVRTYYNKSTEHSNYLITTLIQSKEELDAYYENNKDIYALGHHEDDPKVVDDTIGFLDACEKYTDEYFSKHKLVLISLMENSGSITHKLEYINHYSGGDNEDKFVIGIRRYYPSNGATEDMMGWHIFVELKNYDELPEDTDIKVELYHLEDE